MTDLREPQPGYHRHDHKGGFVQVGEAFALSFDPGNHPTTSCASTNSSPHGWRWDLGTSGHLIPLNVDPPLHAKYRKLLDPLFAPRRMEAQEEDITRRVNGFIDTFVDRQECNFSEEFAELLPSSGSSD